ncbi:Uncharacterized conserved protein [Chryseobacterium taklimakanense]|uniref:Uncharacterized conserved protein n=1 Tax=Chryseobacterium taklimakanense TaxID=536441 RepID=A0A239WEG6_9FLAO|nr:DUF262 domain-containing protein [Chryseobacterium taklimakanense]SNV32014.1 Uncharacterized conserved protein [Chryseobacterium taklimakanense]
MNNEIELLSINDLLDRHFYIPYYQRGYRWTEHHVTDLLEDIYAFSKSSNINDKDFYCLQPVVVKPKTWTENQESIVGYEVIDGQQRLTTIYIILHYLMKDFLKVDSLKEDYAKEIYSLRYETRPKSQEFLKDIKDDKSNIDFFHIAEAYKTVQNWFRDENRQLNRSDKDDFLKTLLGRKEDKKSVQVIWYSVEESVDSVDLFNRLNMGKIPLTNAELIKAIFLSSSSFKEDLPDEANRKKIVISQFWDIIEQQLNDENFWSFVTNSKMEKYATKIELLFDIISKKRTNEIDPLYTFIYFVNESKKENSSLWDLWLSVERYYYTLFEWYKSKNLYHKTGFLITNGYDLKTLIDLSVNSPKSTFEEEINRRISASIDSDFEKLSYSTAGDYKKIEKVLMLFNIESIRTNEKITEFYPFRFHKNQHWSLEHIHAQNSESLDRNKKEQWQKWLSYHTKLMEDVITETSDAAEQIEMQKLLDEVKLFNDDKLTYEVFEGLAKKIIEKFSEKNEQQINDPHNIANLALLGHNENAALNNSVFEVKRRAIISMDKEGAYIPVCTKRVFLKYYNDTNSSQQYYFWGHSDRESYVEEIKKVLAPYIKNQSVLN